jgi:hypothetical protein
MEIDEQPRIAEEKLEQEFAQVQAQAQAEAEVEVILLREVVARAEGAQAHVVEAILQEVVMDPEVYSACSLGLCPALLMAI